ncbi:MAG: O-antigen ligase family protein [Coriobacteriia bacterium]|nr:O-antigen ligase family protein [Coriobacteriia bacterium]
MTEPATPAEIERTPWADRPSALGVAWVLLGTLFVWAFAAHEWAGYGASLTVFAAAAALLCLADERASVVLFIGCSALDAYGYITHVPFSLSVSRVVVVAVVAGAALRWLRAKPRALPNWRALSAWDLGILVFLAAAALSVPLSYSLSLSGVGILHLAFLVGAYFVLSRAARTETGRGDITLATIAAGTVSAVAALGQAFVSGFPLEVMRATETFAESAEVVRASGFFDNPNTMALLLVLSALFAAERAFSTSRLAHQALYAGAVALALAGIGVSFSRAALVGIVVGAVVLGALLIRRARERVAFLVGLVALFALVLVIPGVGERAYSIVDFTTDASAMDRVYLSEVSIEMFADHPVTGVGIQAFRAAYPGYADSRVTIDPVTDGHQMPFSVPAEVGVLGLLAEVVLAGGLLYLLVQSLRAGHEPLAPAGLAAMAAVSVMALFNTFIFFESLWIVAALVGADFLAAHRRATGGA